MRNLTDYFCCIQGDIITTEKIKTQFLVILIYVIDNSDKIVEQIGLDKEICDMEISENGSTIFGQSSTEILKFEYKK